MRILTLNTWGTRGPIGRWPVLIEAIRSLDPDLACLQEVADPRLLSSLDLPTCRHAPESGLGTLSRLTIHRHQVVTYETLSPLEPYRRQALLTEVNVPSGSVPSGSLWVANTHLAWQAEDETTRMGQVEELIRQVAPLGTQVLLCGDFNASPQAPSIQRILESGFVDLFLLLNPQEPGITWDNRNPFIRSHQVKFPDRRIDYVFARKESLSELRPTSVSVVCQTPTSEGVFPSDHYGVLVEFAL